MAYLHHATKEYVDSAVETETDARTAAINTAKSQLQELIRSEASRARGQEDILQQAINSIQTFEVVLADTLPTPSELCAKKIYLVPSANPKATNTKDEYICVQQSGTWKWEQVGSTAITIEYDTEPTDGSSKLVRSGGVYSWVKEEIRKLTSWITDRLAEKQPTIGDLDDIRDGAAAGSTASQPGHGHAASQVSGLKPVATTGSYNDLTDKPFMPTKLSELQNDSGFVTESALAVTVAKKADAFTPWEFEGEDVSRFEELSLEYDEVVGVYMLFGDGEYVGENNSALEDAIVVEGFKNEDETLDITAKRKRVMYHSGESFLPDRPSDVAQKMIDWDIADDSLHIDANTYVHGKEVATVDQLYTDAKAAAVFAANADYALRTVSAPSSVTAVSGEIVTASNVSGTLNVVLPSEVAGKGADFVIRVVATGASQIGTVTQTGGGTVTLDWLCDPLTATGKIAASKTTYIYFFKAAANTYAVNAQEAK